MNADSQYHEEGRAEAYLEGRRAEEILDATLSRTYSKLHQLAFGTAVGIVSLSLLGQFFIGYRVTLAGSLIGPGYAVVVGFLGGYFIAIRYNWSVDLMERRRRGDA